MLDQKEIGKRLQELRRQKGVKMAQASQSLGITYSSLAMIERGERMPRDEVKVKIAHYYGKTVGGIFFGERERK